MTLELRIAGAEDLWLLDAAAPDFFARTILPPADPTMLRALIVRLIRFGIVILAVDGQGAYLGSLALQRDRWEHAPGAYLRERWFHARPGAGGAATALLRGARAIAEGQGLALYLGDLSGRDALRKAAFFERQGGELLGVMVRF